MRRCRSCDGILGQDCFNEDDCLLISHMEQVKEQYKEKEEFPLDGARVIESRFVPKGTVIIGTGNDQLEFQNFKNLNQIKNE